MLVLVNEFATPCMHIDESMMSRELLSVVPQPVAWMSGLMMPALVVDVAHQERPGIKSRKANSFFIVPLGNL